MVGSAGQTSHRQSIQSPRNHQQPELCNDRSLLTRTALCEADIKKKIMKKKHFKEQFLNLFKLFAGEKKKKKLP